MKIQIDSINTRKNQITVFDGEKNVVIPKKDFSSYTDGAKFIPVSEWCDNLDRLKITGKTEFPITFNQSQQDLAKKSKNTIIFSDEEPYPTREELLSKRNIRFYVKDPSFNMDRIPYSATEVELDSSFTEFPHFFDKGGISTLIIPNTVRTDNNEYNFQHCQNFSKIVYKGTKEDFYNNTIFNTYSYLLDEVECEDGTACKTVDLPIMTNEELSNFVIKPFERYILHLNNNNLVDGQLPNIDYDMKNNIEKIVIEKDVVSINFRRRTERLKELYISEGVKDISISDYDCDLIDIKITIPKSTENLTLDNTSFYNINYNGTISEFNSKFQLPVKVTAICSDGIIPMKTPIELQAMTPDELDAYQFLDTENYILHINNENISGRRIFSGYDVRTVYKVIIDEDVTEIQTDLYGLDAVELELPSTLLAPAGNICCCWESLEKINSKSNSDKFVDLSYTRRRQFVEVTYIDGYTELLRFNSKPPPM